jgi:NADH-quinone oxidoreductase subunit G
MHFEHKDPADWVIEGPREFEKIQWSTKITTLRELDTVHIATRLKVNKIEKK